ncbi:MAG TPA: sugar ABC transporter ATP-binding protein [Spirochaetes bacterium]|nr:sugar ABC transporter ATP-binding protein [Spirochaetota bacterium]
MGLNEDPVLQIKGVSKEFPGVKALDGVDMSLKKGEVHALVGENGAGKSTLIKILAGVYTKDSGDIIFENKSVNFHTAADSLRLGIKVVFQELALIPHMTIAENVFLESFPLKKNRAIDWEKMYERTTRILDSIGLPISPKNKVSSLTVSQQQMVEIARALSHEAKIVVMDEPTSALTPNEIKFLFDVIGKLKNLGIGIIYVTHKLAEVFEISDRVTVLRDGKLISSKNVKDTDTDEVVKDMVGRSIKTLFPKTHTGKGKIVLDVRNLSTEKKLKNISFKVHSGEVIGAFGLLGAGRTELAKAVFGLDPITGGKVYIDDRELRAGSTSQSTRMGLGLLTEDRKGEGLVLQMSVAHNITLPSIRDFSTFGFISRKLEKERSNEFVERFSIKTPSLRQKVMFLSGGNQQKVLIARWLMKKLKIIIMDEPTRGIDVGAKAEIHRLIDELAKAGLAVMVMTSEMPELLGVSDHIIVMSNGKITGEFDKKEATQEKILAAAIA